jgi:hypothetical protein
MNKLVKPVPVVTEEDSLPPAPKPHVLANAHSPRAPLVYQGLLSRAWNWIRMRQMARVNSRRLHVAESISLGEKRFVAVVQIDGQQYLIGGGGSNIALLAQLNGTESFCDLLKETMTVPKIQTVAQAKG